MTQRKSYMDELTKIQWNTLEVASGKAGHVPNALLGLLSPDEAERDRSYWQLDNEVVCQSDLYESAYFVVPFLLRMLGDQAPYGRDRMYDLLFEIANGYAPPSVVLRTSTGDEVALRDACAQEVRKGVDIFQRDTANPDPRTSTKARELLDLLEHDNR